MSLFGSSSPFGASNASPFGGTSGTSNPFGTTASSSPFGANQNTSIFGSKPFGSPTFGGQTGSSLFGGTATGAFGPGASSPAFGTSTFGQKTASSFGGFGSTSGQANPFGSTSFGQTQPAFGSSTFGTSTPAFGSSTPAFGSTPFGAASTPAFGATSAPAFGASSTPVFGSSSTSAFGAASTPAFGASSTPAFGAASTPAFGAPSTPSFGAASMPAFGAASTPAFGASSSSIFSSSANVFAQSTSAFGSSPSASFGSSAFGSSGATSFGAQSSAFGASSGFVSPSFGGQRNGSRTASYAATTDAEAGVSGQAGKLISVTAMPTFKSKSFEELRWEDYQAGDKGGPNPPGQQTTGLFGQSPTSTPFGGASSPAFGQTPATSANPFGGGTSSIFGSKPATTFGTPSTGSVMTSSPFGTSSSSPAFGQASSPAFGQASTPAFGQASSPAFGQASMPSFGQSSTPAFGQASAPSFGTSFSSPFGSGSTPSFASGFGTSPSLFGSSTSATSSLFSAGTSTFGANPFTQNASSSSLFLTPSQPATASTPVFGTPTLGSSLFGSSASPFQGTKPAGLSAPGASIFGGASTPAGGFGFSSLGQSQPAMSSFGTTSTPQTNAPVAVNNPFGSLPPLPQMSIGTGVSPGPTVQYGISSMPVTDKPPPLRMTSILTPRHITQRSRIRMQARGYQLKKDGPKTSFFSDGEDTSGISKGDALFVPRENPRALIIRQPPQSQNLLQSSKLANSDLGKKKDDEFQGNNVDGDGLVDMPNASAENGAYDKSMTEDSPPLKNAPKQNGTSKGVHRGNGYASVIGHRAGEAAVAYEHGADIEALMPKLRHSDYFIQPKSQELAAKERAEPGYCRAVKDFVIGRHGYGSLKFLSEVDVRGLDLESIVQFNKCEVLVYMDEYKKPPPGSGLNKPAEITLLNVKCVDKKSGQYLSEGIEVEKFERRLKKKTEEQGAEFISFNAIKGEWKFRVKHFSKYSLADEDLSLE